MVLYLFVFSYETGKKRHAFDVKNEEAFVMRELKMNFISIPSFNEGVAIARKVDQMASCRLFTIGRGVLPSLYNSENWINLFSGGVTRRRGAAVLLGVFMIPWEGGKAGLCFFFSFSFLQHASPSTPLIRE